MIKEITKEIFKEAVDNNILAFDEDAPTGTFTAEFFHILKTLGDQYNYGELIQIMVPTKIKIEKGVYGPVKQVFARWTRNYVVTKREHVLIVRTEELNPSPELNQLIKDTDCTNARYKKFYGIVFYQNQKILCGI